MDQQTHAIQMVAQSPVPIAAGGDILDGQLYFAYGSHVPQLQVALASAFPARGRSTPGRVEPGQQHEAA